MLKSKGQSIVVGTVLQLQCIYFFYIHIVSYDYCIVLATQAESIQYILTVVITMSDIGIDALSSWLSPLRM